MPNEDHEPRRRSTSRAGPTGKVSSAASQAPAAWELELLLDATISRPDEGRLQGGNPRAQLGWGNLTGQLSPGAEARGPAVHYTGGNRPARPPLQDGDFPGLPGTTPVPAQAQPAPGRPGQSGPGRQQRPSSTAPTTPTRLQPTGTARRRDFPGQTKPESPSDLQQLQKQHSWAQKEVIQVMHSPPPHASSTQMLGIAGHVTLLAVPVSPLWDLSKTSPPGRHQQHGETW